MFNGIRAMPMKDLTSDNDSTFSTPRRAYTAFNWSTVTNDEKLLKKWFGNKDASTVTSTNRINQIGLGSLNAVDIPMAFKNTSDPNVRRQALMRVRHGGTF